MKLIKKHILFSSFFMMISLFCNAQKDYYWVGGSGVWEDPAHIHWSTSSGGSAFHNSPPALSDNVYFDINSFIAKSDTVIVGGASINMHDMIWSNTVAGATFVCGANINISGSMSLAADMNFKNNSGVTSFVSDNNETIFTGGTSVGTAQIMKNVTFNGSGLWSLQSYLNVDNDITMDKGHFISNGFGIMCSKFVSNPAVNTNKRIFDIQNSVFKIKSSDNGVYKSWIANNSGKSLFIIPDGSLIEFRGGSGFSTMICGCDVRYNDIDFKFDDGFMIICNDTIHNAVFEANGEILGDNSVFNDVNISLNGTINGSKNNFHNITIGKDGYIGNYSLKTPPVNVNDNIFNDVSIGKTGRVYGDNNYFNNLYFSTAPDLCFIPGVNCLYCGAINDGELHGNNVIVKDKLVFKREGKIYGNNDNIHRATFWCDGWVLSGSNTFDILEIYRHFQECNLMTASLKEFTIHSNILTLQSNKTQTVNSSLNLLGKIMCGNTTVKSSDKNQKAGIYSNNTLTVLYAKLIDLAAANKVNKPDTAVVSEDFGGNSNWFFSAKYSDIKIDSIVVKDVNPCSNSTNGVVSIYASGGIGKLSYAIWVIDTTDPFFEEYWQYQQPNNFTDLYKYKRKFRVEDSLGCSTDFEVTINGPTPVVITALTSKNLTCFDALNGEIHIKGKGGTGSLSFSVDNINYYPSGDFTALAAGDYVITARDSLGCLSKVFNLSLSQPPQLELFNSGSLDTIKCRGNKQGKVVLKAFGGTKPYTYAVVDPDSKYDKDTLFTIKDTLILYGGQAYNAIVTDANNCKATCYFDIVEPDTTIFNFEKHNITCTGMNDGKIWVHPAGGTPPFTYLWSPGNIKSDSIVKLKPGLYSLTITDRNKCTTKDTINLKDPLPVSVTFKVDSVNCKGGNDGIAFALPDGGTPDYTYLWNTGSSDAALTKVKTGSYSVTITDQNKCIGKASVFIPEKNGLSFNYAAVPVKCFGYSDGSAKLNIKGGTQPYTYIWFHDTTITIDAISNVKGGKYVVQVKDINNCQVTNNVIIPEPAPLKVTYAIGNKNCLATGGSWVKAKVTGGSAPYSYKWNNAATTDSLFNLKSGKYKITITDKNGCFIIDSVYVSSLKAKIVINSGCFNQNNASVAVVPIGGSTPYKYKWGGGQINDTIFNLAQNKSYTVSVTDALNCAFDTTFSIPNPAPIKVSSIKSLYNTYNISCFGSADGSITVNPSGGVGPYSYYWSDNSTKQQAINLIKGIYTVTITDANGCILTKTDTLNQPDSINVNIKITNLNCKTGSTTGSATAFVKGGVSPYTWLWSNGNTTNIITNVNPNTYIITVTDKNLCKSKKSIVIGKPFIIIDTVINSHCASSNDGAIKITIKGGSPPFTYKWSNNATTEDIFNLLPGNYGITITDSLGCSALNSAFVSQPSPFVYKVNIDSLNCFGDVNGSVAVEVSGGYPYGLNGLFYSTHLTQYSFLWSTGDTTTAISGKPGGNYTVKVTDSLKCWEIKNVNIFEPLQLLIKIDSSNIKCSGNADAWITPTVSGGTAPYTWQWFKDGVWFADYSDLIGLTQGQYDLTVTDKNNCTAFRTVFISDNSKLSLTPKYKDLNCFGSNDGWINIDVSGGTAPYNYTWSNGLKKDSIFNLSIGSYSLTVTDKNNCFDTVTIVLNQPKKIIPLFKTSDVRCFGDSSGKASVSVNGGAPPYKFLWSNNSTDSTIKSLYSGSYKITITDNSGCSLVDSININQNSQLKITISKDISLCNGDTAYLYVIPKGGIPDYKYKWNNSALLNNDTLQSPYATPKNTTKFTVTVTDNSLCSIVGSVTVNMNTQVTVDAGKDLSTCYNNPVLLNALASGGSNSFSYKWTPEDSLSAFNIPNPIANPKRTSVYHIKVTDKFGCSASDSIKITINKLPKPDFAAIDVCIGFNAMFTDKSIVYAPVVNRIWDFGDNTTDNFNINPSHKYAKTGSFNVSLLVKDSANCQAQISKEINVNPLPIVNFSSSQTCPGQSTYFFDSTKTAGGIANWLWKFGDGSVSSFPNPAHLYQKTGSYPVTLIIDNYYGCSDSLKKIIIIDSMPKVSFSNNTPCLGDTTYFKNTTKINLSDIKNINWFFGDGSRDSINFNPRHKYKYPGLYYVTLIIDNKIGCTLYTIKEVYVSSAPYPDFVAPHICFNNPTVFTDKSFSSLSTIKKWIWDFGDGIIDSLNQNPVHLYKNPGFFNVNLTIFDTSYCKSSLIKQISIDSLPSADFQTDTVCPGMLTSFIDKSKSHGSPNYLWSWDFKDGSFAYYQNTQHLFPATGVYDSIRLVVTNQNGCKDTAYHNVIVGAGYKPSFSFNIACLNDTTWFTNTTKGLDNSAQFYWDFGDGNIDSTENPAHLYQAEGIYNVKLSVKNKNSCVRDTIIKVKVAALPIAKFFSPGGLNTFPVSFFDKSQSTDGTINLWHWNFDNGDTSNLQNPVQVFLNPGYYNVSLIVTDTYGCKDTALIKLLINTIGIAAQFSADTVCEGNITHFKDSSSIDFGTINEWHWNFGDNTISDIQNPDHLYSKSGSYPVTLIIKGSYTADTIIKNIIVKARPVNNFTWKNNCEKQSVNFINNSSIITGSINKYFWLVSQLDSTSAINPVFSFPASGDYTVKLISISDLGCSDTISKIITIHPLPHINFSATPNEGCLPLQVLFTDSSSVSSGKIAAWFWNFGNKRSSVEGPEVISVYNSYGYYSVSLKITTDYGCSDSLKIAKFIYVLPKPDAGFTTVPDITSAINPAISFIDNSSGVDYWHWNFGDGDSSSVKSPVHYYMNAGTYQVAQLVVNHYGCSDTLIKYITISKTGTNYIPNAFSPNDDGHNDVFKPVGIYNDDNFFDITIYDRWGAIIYYSKDINEGWNGRINNTEAKCTAGVYIWVIITRDIDGFYHKQYGNVTLVR